MFLWLSSYALPPSPSSPSPEPLPPTFELSGVIRLLKIALRFTEEHDVAAVKLVLSEPFVQEQERELPVPCRWMFRRIRKQLAPRVDDAIDELYRAARKDLLQGLYELLEELMRIEQQQRATWWWGYRLCGPERHCCGCACHALDGFLGYIGMMCVLSFVAGTAF